MPPAPLLPASSAPAAVPAHRMRGPTTVLRGAAGARWRAGTRAAATVLALVLAALPLSGCEGDGEKAMRSWLADQQVVESAEVYCTSHMETGCQLHNDVTLAPGTSAADASAFIDAALEAVTQDSSVRPDMLSLDVTWQYHSAQIEHGGVLFQTRTPDADAVQAPAMQALREELLTVATDLAEDGVESVTTYSHHMTESGSLAVERGDVEALPTSLLADTPFTRPEAVGLEDHFSLAGWEIQIHSSAQDEVPTSLVSDVAQVALPDGTKPSLLLDSTEAGAGTGGEPGTVVEVRGLQVVAGDYGDYPDPQQAAPVLAAVMGTPVLSKARICSARGAARDSEGYSCVFYDMQNGAVDRASGYPYREAKEIYDEAERLAG